MLDAVIEVLERTPGVVRRVNVDALDLASELLFERLEGEQIVAEDEPVIKDVVVRDASWSVIRPLRILEQNARLEPGPVLLPNPCQFQFLFLRYCHAPNPTPMVLSQPVSSPVASE